MILMEEDAVTRTCTFCSLFSQQIKNNMQDKEKGITDQQSSKEEWLQEFNSTLPSGFKTSEERMSDINRELIRFPLYTKGAIWAIPWTSSAAWFHFWLRPSPSENKSSIGLPTFFITMSGSSMDIQYVYSFYPLGSSNIAQYFTR
jgi:hypothetical protein